MDWDQTSLYQEVKKQVAIKNTYNSNKINFGDGSWTEIPCREHRADTLRVDYLDGVYHSYCTICKSKMVFEKMPGELPKIKLKGMLADLMVGKSIDFEELVVVQEALKKEQEQMEETQNSLRLVREIIEHRYAEQHDRENAFSGNGV